MYVHVFFERQGIQVSPGEMEYFWGTMEWRLINTYKGKYSLKDDASLVSPPVGVT